MPELNQNQFQLFDPGPRQKPRPNMNAFVENAQWHATNVENWGDEIKRQGVPVHSGTPGSAIERAMHHDAVSFYPVQPHRVGEEVSDPEANLAHIQYENRHGLSISQSAYDTVHDGEFYSHVADAMNPYDEDDDEYYDFHEPPEFPDIPNPATDELEDGLSIPYENTAEDRGSLSYLSPPGGFSTARDVARQMQPDYSPREHFTRSELFAQGFGETDSERQLRISSDFRLIEEDVKGNYYAGEDHPLVEQERKKQSGENVRPLHIHRRYSKPGSGNPDRNYVGVSLRERSPGESMRKL